MEAHQELHRIINDREMKDSLLLVFANKQDIKGGECILLVTNGRSPVLTAPVQPCRPRKSQRSFNSRNSRTRSGTLSLAVPLLARVSPKVLLGSPTISKRLPLPSRNKRSTSLSTTALARLWAATSTISYVLIDSPCTAVDAGNAKLRP